MRKRRKNVIIFVVGCLLGVLLEHILNRKVEVNQIDAKHFSKPPSDSYIIKNNAIFHNNATLLYDSGSTAKRYFEVIPILCWVLTQKETLHTKAQSIKDTWGKRCNVLLFFSSENDKDFPAISLGVKEGLLYVDNSHHLLFAYNSTDSKDKINFSRVLPIITEGGEVGNPIYFLK